MVKAVAIEMCCRLSGLTQRELSGHFGYRSESSVGRQRKTLALRLAADPSLRRKVDDLAKRLANRKL